MEEENNRLRIDQKRKSCVLDTYQGSSAFFEVCECLKINKLCVFNRGAEFNSRRLHQLVYFKYLTCDSAGSSPLISIPNINQFKAQSPGRCRVSLLGSERLRITSALPVTR